MLICDEAHRTAGIFDEKNSSGFKLVHTGIAAHKRLYQTATPRIYTERSKTVVSNRGSVSDKTSEIRVVDMSDVQIYGPEFFSLSFAKALDLMPERMCDYRVVVMLMDRNHENLGIEKSVDQAQLEDKNSRAKKTNTAIGARLAALVKTLHGGAEVVSLDEGVALGTGKYVDNISNCIVYCNTVVRSRWVSNTLNVPEVSEWGFNQVVSERNQSATSNGHLNIPINAGHLDANSRSFTRFAELDSLRTARGNHIRKVLSNVGVLSEGIDVPALDAICFLEDRKSEIDIVQAVGRIMRRPPDSDTEGHSNKKFGYIIVPVMVDIQADIFDQISSREDGWRILGQVLRALRAHDPRIETDLHERIIIHEPRPKPNGNDKKLPSLGFLDKLRAGDYNQIIPSVVASSGMNQEPAEVANLIEYAVKRAANNLRDENLEAHLELQLGMRGQSDDKKKSTDACTVAALIFCNAMLMHQRIVQVNRDPFTNIARVDEVRAHATPEKLLVREWKKILEHDYEPVFRQPLNLLDSLNFAGRVSSGVRFALYTLAENAVDTAERYAKMGMDHAGPLFQRVMKNKASDGAFFTLPIAAVLLAELVLDEIHPPYSRQWRSSSTWKNQAVLDPACGSGTLLMAILTAVKRRAKNLGASEQELSAIHQSLVERGLTGLDINAQSIQIAACQQTIGDTSVNYREMGLWVMPHGFQSKDKVDDHANPDDVALGSLELFFNSIEPLESQLELNLGQKELFEEHTISKSVKAQLTETLGESQGEKLQDRLSRTKIVVYNPPYTNSAGRAEKFSPTVKKAMQTREAQIRTHVEKIVTRGKRVIDSTSISTFFTPLIDAILDKQTGVVGKVMPTIACTTSSGRYERIFLAENFNISKVITLHGHGKINWSTETKINESIMIMDRNPTKSRPTTFIALCKRPANEHDAIDLAHRIRDGNLDDWGNSSDWPRNRMLEGDWSPGIWYHFELAEIARQIRTKDGHLSTKLTMWQQITESANIYSTGPSLRNKKKWKLADAGETFDIAVCKSKGESVHHYISSDPETGYIAINPSSRERDLALMKEKRSSLLITEGQATDSARLCAIVVDSPSVGGGWVPVVGVNEFQAKAWSVYLNSTLGRISILSYRRKKLNFGQYATSDLNQLNVPNLQYKNRFEPLIEAYEETKRMEVNQYRDGDCKARVIWDNAVSKVTGISAKKIEYWRKLLNSELSVLGGKSNTTKHE